MQEIVNKAVTKAVEDLSDVIAQFATNVDARFDKVENDIADLNTKYNRLLDTMDAVIKRIDDYETEATTRDSQLAPLEKWVEQIAKETGVKLEC